MTGEIDNELGEAIKSLRLSQRQINGRPWSQEDLAVAIGSDKSHINRLEKGKQIPNAETLERICNALGVGWNTRKRLFALAGHLPSFPTPKDDEIQGMVDMVEPQLAQQKYPASLLDNELRIWTINDICAYSYYGYPNSNKFLNECQGLRLIELLMTPSFREWFERIIVNFNAFFRRQVTLFREEYLKHQKHIEYQNILKQFLKWQDFREVWQDLQEHRMQQNQVTFIDHQFLEVVHPDLGRYSVQVWHCQVANDNRFKITSHIPNDTTTIKIFNDLYESFKLA